MVGSVPAEALPSHSCSAAAIYHPFFQKSHSPHDGPPSRSCGLEEGPRGAHRASYRGSGAVQGQIGPPRHPVHLPLCGPVLAVPLWTPHSGADSALPSPTGPGQVIKLPIHLYPETSPVLPLPPPASDWDLYDYPDLLLEMGVLSPAVIRHY